MLVEFRVKNFRSFKEEQVLSMVASNDNSLPDNCIEVEGGKLRLLKTVGIYGANASGKSNLIKAMKVMSDWLRVSTSEKAEKEIPVSPFLFDEEYSKKPSEFEITFIHDNIKYQYGFTATKICILEEWLYAYPKGRAQTWFNRYLDNKTNTAVIKPGGHLKSDWKNLSKKTKNKYLFLSVAEQWNDEQLTPVHTWLSYLLRIVVVGIDLNLVTTYSLVNAKKNKSKDNDLLRFFVSMMQSADFGVTGVDLKVDETIDEEYNLGIIADDLTDEEKEHSLEEFKKLLNLKVMLMHKNTTTGMNVLLPLEEESLGTQRYYQFIGPIYQMVNQGLTVCFDELERSLHPLLSRHIIEFIQNPKINKTDSQLIFTTHDTTLLDSDLLRRDQIYFTEKDESGATQLLSMYDYKNVRKNEAMQKGYLAGRYGAIPILEKFGME